MGGGGKRGGLVCWRSEVGVVDGIHIRRVLVEYSAHLSLGIDEGARCE